MELPKKGQIASMAQIEEICAEYNLYDLWAKIKEDPPEKPFKSDGCSGGWPDEWRSKRTGKKVSIYPCAWFHDLKYWANYPNDEVARLIADAELVIDVVKITGDVNLAKAMFFGVRMGGGSFWGKSYSFGFGRK